MSKRRIIVTNGIICSVLLVLGYFVLNLNTRHTYLSTTAPLYNGNRNTNQIALMFIVDNTAAANNLPTIIQALENAHASASFFLAGAVIPDNLALIKELSLKFELGNYGFSNINLNIANKNTITDEITICDQLVQNLTTQKMTLFTPPNCLYNKNTLGIAENLGYTTILPTVRQVSIDWDSADTNLVHAYATTDTQAGDIVLLRPITATRQGIAKILATFLNRDLTITSVGQLLAS